MFFYTFTSQISVSLMHFHYTPFPTFHLSLVFFENLSSQVQPTPSHLIHSYIIKPKRYFNLYIIGILSCRHNDPKYGLKSFIFHHLHKSEGSDLGSLLLSNYILSLDNLNFECSSSLETIPSICKSRVILFYTE